MPTGQVSAVNCFASVYPGSPTSGEFTSANRILVEPTSSVSPSTMYVTVSVKQAAVPLHWGMLPDGGPLGGPLEGLKEKARTPTTSAATMIMATPSVQVPRMLLPTASSGAPTAIGLRPIK